MFNLAVCAEMVFLDLPFEERVRRIAESGFQVEIWNWTRHDIDAVARPGLRMMLDLYHAQIGEGNLIQLLKRAGSLIGEVQVADVPGRCEPGTGEINFAAIAAALKEMGYRGTVGLEAYASGDDKVALERFSAAFGAGTSAQQQPSDD